MQQPMNPQAQALLQSLMGNQGPQGMAPQGPAPGMAPPGMPQGMPAGAPVGMPQVPQGMPGMAPMTQSNFGQMMGMGRKVPSVEELLFKAQKRGGQ